MARDDQKTEMYSQMDWKEPVRSLSDLPDIADEGDCVYVQEESAVFAFRDGTWVKEIARQKDG